MNLSTRYRGPQNNGELIDPILEALLELGGIHSIDEILDKVVEIEGITKDILSVINRRDGRPEVRYRIRYQLSPSMRDLRLTEGLGGGHYTLTDRGREEARKPRRQREHNISRGRYSEPGQWRNKEKVGSLREQWEYDNDEISVGDTDSSGKETLPNTFELVNPLLNALRELGGSGSIGEIDNKVIELENISEDAASIIHAPERGNQTAIEYRLAWSRTILKRIGYLENSSRGIWNLTKHARERNYVVEREEIQEAVRQWSKRATNESEGGKSDLELSLNGDVLKDMGWEEELNNYFAKEMSPVAFERFVQRLLRESGFIQVEVTKQTGDGGIDGKGIFKVNDFLSFRVVFQCKKYSGSVSSGDIRNFRGAIEGRADRGLFITTGVFTSEAVKEAARDGASRIDLVDGKELMDKLKELRLGVKVEMVEKVTVDKDWFQNL